MRLMKYSKSLLLLIMILPWFSIPLLGKHSINRFLPSAIFMSIVVSIVHMIAEKRKWWWWYVKLHPKLIGGLSFIAGPYFIGSIWILKFTYGEFRKFIFLNLLIDSLFTFVLIDWLKKLGIASLVRLNKFQLLIIFFIDSILLYSFQYSIEKLLKVRTSKD
ncbi:hypothetical protein [Cytobacillus praedii]|uniref:hypothetical protein n=1 Tax=Cytobacillus praedii TaxID=1742358 RepID=UPI002E1AC0A7|nr:hypothetical protein [Cytobacillus praedii]